MKVLWHCSGDEWEPLLTGHFRRRKERLDGRVDVRLQVSRFVEIYGVELKAIFVREVRFIVLWIISCNFTRRHCHYQ